MRNLTVQDRITEAAADTFLVEGPASNWIIVRDGADFTLVDSGYPSDTRILLDSIDHLGLKPARTAVLLITHAHTDHTGGAAYLSENHGRPRPLQ